MVDSKEYQSFFFDFEDKWFDHGHNLIDNMYILSSISMQICRILNVVLTEQRISNSVSLGMTHFMYECIGCCRVFIAYGLYSWRSYVMNQRKTNKPNWYHHILICGCEEFPCVFLDLHSKVRQGAMNLFGMIYGWLIYLVLFSASEHKIRTQIFPLLWNL